MWEFFTSAEEEVYECNLCGAFVPSVNNSTKFLDKHLIKSHPSTVRTVPGEKSRYQDVMQEVEGPSEGFLECPLCFKKVKSRGAWNHHRRMQHTHGKFKCAQCGHIANCAADLVKHIMELSHDQHLLSAQVPSSPIMGGSG